ncbi:MAG: glycosyltransferase family 4 protein [Salinivirgaceae bacterium]|nr:glycosyltransferase family 4 protein [Salinivirgaceae bacterium]
MRIVVNTQLLLPNRLEGLGWFTHETLKRITRNHPEHEFVFIFDRPWDTQFIYSENILPIYTRIPSRHPLLWYVRFEHIIPRFLKKYGADIFVSTDGWTTLSNQCKTYDVIHDLNFVHNPGNFPYLTRKYYNYFSPKFARHSTRLATVSEYSKSDLVKTWGLAPETIDVIYNGSHEIFQPLHPSAITQTLTETTQGVPYFIYIGSLNPRKNIEGMLLAFDRFKQQTQLPHKLMIVGEKMWRDATIDRVFERLPSKKDVLFMGRQSTENLHRLLGSSIALVLVSHLEGFGIPLIEAMNCDVPVICSNTTAMPEVAGKAGHLVNPSQIESIAEGFRRLASEPDYRNQLIEHARIQKTKFSWDQSATKLWDSIEKCMNS